MPFRGRFRLAVPRPSDRLLRGLVVAGVVAVAVVAALPVVTGRTMPRWFSLQSARLAVAEARQAGSQRWAPSPLQQAEAALRAALIEHRHQETRFLLFRDFTLAEAELRAAEQKATAATREALRKRRAAQRESKQAIEEAIESVSGTDAFAHAMPLASHDRRMLQKSKIALTEAKIFHTRGDYHTASERATQAELAASQVGERAASAAARFTDAHQIEDWRRMIRDTIAWSRLTGRAAVVVCKDRHVLTLYVAGKPFRAFTAELGANAASDKLRAGDLATPEGRYKVTSKKGPGMSTYYKALLLNYPNDEDRRRFAKLRRSGEVSRATQMGGLIEIHGEGGRGKDWTNGCVALSNGEMDALFAKVDVGTPVTIVGGDGNGGVFSKLVAEHRGGGVSTRDD